MDNFTGNQLQSEAWTKEQVFIDGDEYFESLINGLLSAKETILFETYIFEKCKLGDRVFDALCTVAKRGVSVNILIDGYGSKDFSSQYEDELSNLNIHVRYYRTLPWDLKTRETDSPNFFHRLRSRIYRFNHGTHRKYCLIDGQRLWTGSFNVSDFHSKALSGSEAWRDMGAYVEGPEVIWVERAFLQSFEKHKELKRQKGNSSKLVLLNQTRHLKKVYRSVQIEKLKSAESRVWIETPYFVPLARVFRNLIRLAKSGVDVRIIVPRRNDVWLVKWISYSYLIELAKQGVKIYEYQPRFLHNKLFIIDRWMCLGSTNLNHRSFLHDLEMDVVLSHEDNKNFIEQTVLDDIANSVPIDKEIWEAFPWWKWILSRVLSIFAYWS